ncbi:hypothetical protein BX600DRAFT_430529 [Xylariales sp. PMI_506]|nr:hypothetical protein BX600DRAFT_430529 [Xylariales sp. PMI_506]
MAPSTIIPRALARAHSSSSIHHPISSLTRAFSATSFASSNRIPPESPAFINVPAPPLSQSVEDQKPARFSQKGHLPIPRRVLKRRTGELSKIDPEFLTKSAPVPTSERSQRAPGSEKEAWRRHMADLRRRNLEEGIQDLWTRKQKVDTEVSQRFQAKVRQHRRARNAPQRDDERFTDTTIPANIMQTVVPLDPARFERALESRARTEGIHVAKSQARKDSLQQLYMAAREFIVDEKDLLAAVEAEFDPNRFADGGSGSGVVAENAWDLYGKPTTVKAMVSEVMRTDHRAVFSMQDESNRTAKRQQRVAEELTGGPMDDVKGQ